MSNSTAPSLSYRFSPCATWAALGIRLQGLTLFGPVRDQVHMGHKTIPHTPVQTWYDAFIAILAGAHGLVEINKRRRSDPGLPAALGRQACAAQAVGQETLEACPEAHVAQMHEALDTLYRRQRRGSRHDSRQTLQRLEVEMTGMPCGTTAALATTGSLAKQRQRRGRQLGRVGATRYDAIVVARLCGGTTPLTSALRPLVQAAERTRALDEAKRRQPVWRLDAGGGSVADVTWLLEHNSHVPCKAYAGTRAQTVAASVTAGGDDPRIPERPGGWVTVAPTASNRPVRRVAGRCRKKNGPWGVGGVSATLAPAEVRALARQPVDRLHAPSAVLLA